MTSAIVTKLRMIRHWSAVILVVQAGLVFADDQPVVVFTSLMPHAEFVAEIGGPLVEVTALVGPGHSPANYQPTPRQMASLAAAQLYVAADVPFEGGLLAKIEASGDQLVFIGGFDPNHLAHHGNPHAWLNPLHVAALADSICEQLSLLTPGHGAILATRRDRFKKRLLQLDAEIARMMRPYRGREFFVFHPAYGHFAERYDLVQVAVEDAGHEPGAQQLVKIIEQAQAAKASVIIVQPQFSQRSAAAVAESCAAEILVLDPLAADYEANLMHIAKSLVQAWDSES